MRRRLFASSTICGLLALHLGLACLAIARTHDAMPMDDARCEAGATAEQKLLCAAPSTLAPPASQSPQPIAGILDVLAVVPSPVAAPAASLTQVGDPGPPGDPPAFLLHRALLI